MVAYILIFGIFGLIIFLTFWTTINYKFKAESLGVTISWGQVVGQRLRKTLTADILEAAALAAKENLNIDIIQLETHKLAGGDPLKVIQEIVVHKHKGQILEFNIATALDLGGEDLRKFRKEYHNK